MKTIVSALLVVLILQLVAPTNSMAHEGARDREFAASIANLQQAVSAEASTRENIAERLDTFWLWVNDYALRGLAIDPDVPATVARIRDPGLKSQIAMQDLEDIDRWVREFSFREANPRAIGSLSSPRLGGYEVDAFHSLVINYQVGERALEEGDGFVLGELTYGKGPLLQARNPKGDNFVSISSDVDGAEFQIEGYPIRGMFSGTMARSVIMTGPAQKVFFRLKRGRIPAGEKVTITLGDQTFGSRGVGLIAPSVDALRFRVWLHLQHESLLLAMPELEFQSVGGAVVGVRGFAPSIVKVGEPFEVGVRFEDQFRNRATGQMPAVSMRLDGKVLARAEKGTESVFTFPNIRFDSPGVYRLDFDAKGLTSTDVNPIVAKESPQRMLLWGETHGHSGFSEGMGSIDGVYQFARDDARLDFMALTEHDYWMDDAEWETLREAAIRYNEPGKFLAFLAYEWTVPAQHGGHHNIVFRTPEGRDRVPRQEVQTLDKLYERLLAESTPEDLLLIPHAHNPGDWAQNEPDTERFVEIVSLHGTFEWFGRRYLDEGFMVGFLGGSDDHMGHPGLRPLRRNPTSDNFGGLLGLYAENKTNNAVFDAMRDIRGYATNGVRAVLDVDLNGHLMGSKIRPYSKARFHGSVHGTAPIEELVLWKNGQVVYTQDFALSPHKDEQTRYVEVRFWSDSYPRSKGKLARQWRRWRGTITALGARVASITSPQNDNPYTEFVMPRAEDGQIADYFLKTRGSYKSILLALDGSVEKTRLKVEGIKESPLPAESIQTYEFDVSLSNLSEGDHRYDIPVEGYDDHFVVREVFPPSVKDRSIDIELSDPLVQGDYFYLRVRQSDGGLIWSSPFRVE